MSDEKEESEKEIISVEIRIYKKGLLADHICIRGTEIFRKLRIERVKNK